METTVEQTATCAQADGDAQPVLLVEDDQQVQHVLRCSLEDDGVPVETAANGRQALAAATRCHPGVVVLDLGASHQEGLRMATELRAICGPDIPLVVITADQHAPRQAQQIDAAAYFYKPFPLVGVVNCVRYLLQSHPH